MAVLNIQPSHNGSTKYSTISDIMAVLNIQPSHVIHIVVKLKLF